MAPVKKPPHSRKKTFLREWRKYREMSLESAAEAVGIDHSTLQRIEVRKSPYNQDLLEKLAAVYMADVVDLLTVNPLVDDPLAPMVQRLRKSPVGIQIQAAAVVDAMLKTRS